MFYWSWTTIGASSAHDGAFTSPSKMYGCRVSVFGTFWVMVGWNGGGENGESVCVNDSSVWHRGELVESAARDESTRGQRENCETRLQIRVSS